MATIVNNPAPQGDSSGTGLFIGAILAISLLGIFIFYGVPAIRNMGPIQVNVPAPEVNVPAPQVNIEAPAASSEPAK